MHQQLPSDGLVEVHWKWQAVADNLLQSLQILHFYFDKQLGKG